MWLLQHRKLAGGQQCEYCFGPGTRRGVVGMRSKHRVGVVQVTKLRGDLSYVMASGGHRVTHQHGQSRVDAAQLDRLIDAPSAPALGIGIDDPTGRVHERADLLAHSL